MPAEEEATDENKSQSFQHAVFVNLDVDLAQRPRHILASRRGRVLPIAAATFVELLKTALG
jgi:hypothetical protein